MVGYNYYGECLTLVLKDGRVVVCQPNGYVHRTLENGYSGSCIGTSRNNDGPVYWMKQAMKNLQFGSEDVLMKAKGKVAFRN